jgi:membrane associated rhomboid family serine protease
MLPLSDGIPARRFLFVNVALIPANFAVFSAWVFLGLWFLYQLIESDSGLFSAQANGGGVAFFAHVGGFLFGVAAAALLAYTGKIGATAGGPIAAGASP